MNRLLIIAATLLLILPSTALSQARSRTTRRGTPARTSKPVSADAAAAAKAEGATRVANQVKNLTAFLYLLGGVAKDLDAQETALRSGTGSPTQQRNKARIIATFEDFRVGVDNLENYFSSTSELRPYYAKLLGSADAAATAKTQAASGHVEQAGHTLVNLVSQLTDLLALMR